MLADMRKAAHAVALKVRRVAREYGGESAFEIPYAINAK